MYITVTVRDLQKIHVKPPTPELRMKKARLSIGMPKGTSTA